MSWPTPLDYQTALQNPAASLADPELRAGKVENDPMGLPKPRTGTFASVYKVQCGQRAWAIRCFLMDFRDQQERYNAISRHLARVSLPYMVGFQYLPKGILVGKQWYPVLKMEWVEGERLDRYIEKNLHNPSLLLSLAIQWIEMVKRLQQASIAHGDFQHGNIFIEGGRLRLIDYDGMFVPELKGCLSHETGHRNYQHPRRSESDFGLYLDNFSAWVVYLSLAALSVDADLWQRFKGGDECLLFRSRDFEHPDSSDLFRSLEGSSDERIRSAATLFKSLVSLNPRQFPFLDGRAPVLPPPEATLPAWLKDHVKPSTEKQPGSSPANPAQPAADPAWILDFLPEGSKGISGHFENSLLVERFALAFSFLDVLLLFSAAPWRSGTNLLGLLVIVNVLLWVYRYHLEPSVIKLNALQSDLKTIGRSISQAERQIKAFELEKTELRNRFKARLAQLESEKRELEATRSEKMDATQKKLQASLASIDDRRMAARQQEASALQDIQKTTGAKVAGLSQKIGDLAQAEAGEISKTLQEHQQDHILSCLRAYPVKDAALPGFGEKLKSRLVAAGVSTAAEISPDRVKLVNGIGQERAAALARWRQSLETTANASMPGSLPKNELAAISASYQNRRSALEGQMKLEKQHLETAERDVRQRNTRAFQKMMKEDESARAKAQREAARILRSYDKAVHSKENGFAKLSKKTEAELLRANDSINDGRMKLSDLRWKQEMGKRQLKLFDEVQFADYIRRVFQFWKG